MRISDWSSDVCSSDLLIEAGVVTIAAKGVDPGLTVTGGLFGTRRLLDHADGNPAIVLRSARYTHSHAVLRSEEHTSELQSLMRISYAVFCLQKKNHKSHKSYSSST